MEVIYKNKSYRFSEAKKFNDLLTVIGIPENRLCVFVDGKYPEVFDINSLVKTNSTVWIYPELSGRTGFKIGATVALIAATVLSGGVGSTATPGFLGGFSVGGQIALRTGILLAGVAVATGLQALAPRSIAKINGEENISSPTYSLINSGNAFRPFQPMPLVLGTHNIFPDFSAIPYNEFKTYDPTFIYNSNVWHIDTAFNEIAANMTVFFAVVAPVTGETFNLASYAGYPIPVLGLGEWIRYNGGFAYRNSETSAQTSPPPAIGDQYKRCFFYVVTCPAIPALNGTWVSWEDFFTNGSNANFSAPMLTFTNVENYIYDTVGQNYPRKTEVVKQIMNYGWGDLVFLQNKIGTTDANDFREYTEKTTEVPVLTQTPTDWPLPQWEPNFNFFGSPAQYFLDVHGNVDTVDGGRLDNVPGFSLNAPGSNYVIRQGPGDTFGIQLDIEGRQFALDKVNGGTAILTRYFDIQYRRILPTVGPWTNFQESMTLGSGFATPYALTHGSSGEVYRDTLWVDSLTPAQYEVRARRRDASETSQDLVSEIYLKRVRFYQRDIAQNYVAQNRKAVIVESDSQLNGTLNKLSSLVAAKCWRNDGAGNFTWTTTSNPADWYLYYLRGLFKNDASDGTFTYPYSPTIGWQNNADHPDNGEFLIGVGVSDAMIDFASITDWWNYCNTNNIEFAAVLDKTENIFETLRKITSVGRGSPTNALGKFGVVFENPNQLPVAMFTPENILKDSFSMTYITEDLPDEIIVNFMNEADNWQQDSVRALAIGVTNPSTSQTFDFWGITIESQAQREANRLAARQTYNRRLVKFSIDGEGLMVTRGDVCIVSHDLFSWDYSSRIFSTENDGVNIIRFVIDCEIDDTVSHVSIRLPNGNINHYAATVAGNVITLIDPFPLVDAPYYLDQQNTVNALSAFPETVPEDYLITAGNRAEPGRKMRITGITAKTENEYEIECSEEDPGFYAQEYILSGLPPPEQFERVRASVTRADFILKGNGKAVLYWDLDGASGVSIVLTINAGIPFLYTIGGATHFGNDVEIAYSSGDVIQAVITPIFVDSPYVVETKTLNFTLT